MKTPFNIAVVGAGAVGSVIGGLLAHAGEHVTLIGRKAHVAAINQHGLSIRQMSGVTNIQVHTAEALTFSADLVLLAVKTQDLESTCRAIRPYVQNSSVVTLQNGVQSADIAASVLGKHGVLSGIVYFNARFIQPGEVAYTSPGSIVLGELFSKNGERVKEIRAVLNQAVPTTLHSNIHGAQWTKLFINILGNSLEAVTGLSVYEGIRHRSLRKIAVLLLKEALRVVEQAGIQLTDLPELPGWLLKGVIKSPLPLAAGIMGIMLRSKRYENVVTSTLQSLRQGKPTEIDYLNGEIVKIGKQVGIPTPCNSQVVDLVHEIEHTHQFVKPERLESLFFRKSTEYHTT